MTPSKDEIALQLFDAIPVHIPNAIAPIESIRTILDLIEQLGYRVVYTNPQVESPRIENAGEIEAIVNTLLEKEHIDGEHLLQELHHNGWMVISTR